MSTIDDINPKQIATRLGRFTWRVLRRFYLNKGLLLAGAVGYNALLSLIPLLAVVLVVLSKVLHPQDIFEVVSAEISIVFPGQADALNTVLLDFLSGQEVFGVVGFAVLLFFASIAFRMMEDAMAVIFRHHKTRQERHPLISFAIPFAYITSISIGLLVLTVMATTWEAMEQRQVMIFSAQVSIPDYAFLLKLGGFVGEVLLFASFYRVLPTAHVRYKLALIGGFVAATLWEATRAIMVWYFASISLVNIVYGSLATIIIILLSLEIAAIIILLGAQVIAELEVSSEEGLKWYEEPEIYMSGRFAKPAPHELLDTGDAQ